MKELLRTLWSLVSPAKAAAASAAAAKPAAVIPPMPAPPANVILEMAGHRDVGIDPVDMVYGYVRRTALLRRARSRWLARSWADQVESPLSDQFRAWHLPGERN